MIWQNPNDFVFLNHPLLRSIWSKLSRFRSVLRRSSCRSAWAFEQVSFQEWWGTSSASASVMALRNYLRNQVANREQIVLAKCRPIGSRNSINKWGFRMVQVRFANPLRRANFKETLPKWSAYHQVRYFKIALIAHVHNFTTKIPSNQRLPCKLKLPSHIRG